jgi:hypothetical protein
MRRTSSIIPFPFDRLLSALRAPFDCPPPRLHRHLPLKTRRHMDISTSAWHRQQLPHEATTKAPRPSPISRPSNTAILESVAASYGFCYSTLGAREHVYERGTDMEGAINTSSVCTPSHLIWERKFVFPLVLRVAENYEYIFKFRYSQCRQSHSSLISS